MQDKNTCLTTEFNAEPRRVKTGLFTTEGTEGTEEYIFTMKNMKGMKITHESANERRQWLHPFADSDFTSVFSVNSVVKKCIFVFFLCVLWTIMRKMV